MKLFIPVGIPGCGKSSYAQWLLQSCVISTDSIREEMVGEGLLESVSDMSRNDEVFDKYHKAIEDTLLDDNVYADATNLRDFARQRLRYIAELAGAETYVIVFNNLHEAIRRNQGRERVVPPEVMGSMLEQHERALRDIPNETYTKVVYIESFA